MVRARVRRKSPRERPRSDSRRFVTRVCHVLRRCYFYALRSLFSDTRSTNGEKTMKAKGGSINMMSVLGVALGVAVGVFVINRFVDGGLAKFGEPAKK